MIPFQLHRRLPFVRRPFYQRDLARAEVARLTERLAKTEQQRDNLAHARAGAAIDRPDFIDVIAPNDAMLDSGPEEYRRVGCLALGLCRVAMADRVPRRIIDFPSGHGRVTRWLRWEWSTAEIYAVEIDQTALDFCSKTFSTIPIVGNPSLDNPLPSGVDLVFSGSLLTHTTAAQTRNFLRNCFNVLSDDGSLIVTTHGRIAALLARERDPIFGTLIDTTELYRNYIKCGFAYRSYDPNYPTYGLTLASLEWMQREIFLIPRARISSFTEGGWGYQDVYIIRRNPWPIGECVPQT